MNEAEPSEITRLEQEVERRHPIQRLFMIDVLKDRESRPVLFWAAGMLLFGTLAYHFLEGWSLLDSLYFCVITLATVGYGDLTPTTPLARAFTIIYVLNGIVVLLTVFDRIRIVRTRHLPRRSKG
jgi:hypothetical protein